MMHTIETKHAKIRYDKVGNGPGLLLIPGASGINDSYLELSKTLENNYTVIMPDRSGYGVSELLAPLPASIANSNDTHRLEQDIDDMAEVIQNVSTDPVYVFGTDTAGVVALGLLEAYPNLIKKVLVHEPFHSLYLPNHTSMISEVETIVRTAMIEGIPAAMRRYERVFQPSEVDMQILVEDTIAPCAVCTPDTAQQRSSASTEIWMQYELRQYMQYALDIKKLRQYQQRIVFLQGDDSKGSFGYEAAMYLGNILDATVQQVPGGHYGYAQKPKAFGARIKQVLSE